MKAFKAYDIRGVYNRDWNKDDAYAIGFFLPRLLQADEIWVGRDIRLSSNEIFEALSLGIRAGGAEVVDLGLCTTPMVYWATAHYGVKGSVQITASHNPAEYNGLKVSSAQAMPVGYNSGLHKIQHWMKTEKINPVADLPGIRSIDIRQEYLNFMSQYIPDLKQFSILIDASNGMAGLLIEDIFGEQADYMNLEPDGRFPNHDPNPLEIENVAALSQAVVEGAYDLGIIFDGDADRVMFVDEHGQFISPDLMIAVLGQHFLRDQRKVPVLQDIRSSRSVGEHLEPMGAKMSTWRVGRAFATPKLRAIDGLFGGELAGHYYFKDFYYSDSGILAALLISGALAKLYQTGISVSEYIKVIDRYQGTGEINYLVTNKAAAIEAVTEFFLSKEKPLNLMDFDGLRLDYADWWMNIRPSNTEPYLRFIAEARTQEHLDEIMRQVEQLLKPFLESPTE